MESSPCKPHFLHNMYHYNHTFAFCCFMIFFANCVFYFSKKLMKYAIHDIIWEKQFFLNLLNIDLSRHLFYLLIAAPIGLGVGDGCLYTNLKLLWMFFIIWGFEGIDLSYTFSSIYADHSCSCNDPSCTLVFLLVGILSNDISSLVTTKKCNGFQ